MQYISLLLESPCVRQIPDVTDWDLQRNREWLHQETKAYLNDVFVRSSLPHDVIMLEEAHKQGFTCRELGCDLQFPLQSARVR